MMPACPRRAIHLDFHTGPDIPDVAADFDPRRFAQPFREAHVDSVTVFAKCHHGQLYYSTDRAERHPALPAGLDLLGEQIEALHAAGIQAPIYMSIQCDEYAANHHPEWIALTEDLKHVKRTPPGRDAAFEAGWQILDMSSPYQDYVAGQLDEVLRRFAPVDGMFLDMCWDQPSCSRWAFDGMRRTGLNPREPDDRRRYARQLVHQYMSRFRKMIYDAQRGRPFQGIWFNSRPKTNLYEEAQYVEHVEVESLPTGGWGYAYLPYVARFVRPVGKPSLGMTARFHRSWGDNAGLKPTTALQYECCQNLSHGLASSVGDVLPPRGVPQPAAYRRIGEVYRYIHACEPYMDDARAIRELALVVDPALGDSPGHAGIGAVRLLQQLRQQFDILPVNAALDSYRTVILPETTRIDHDLRARLTQYVQQGGKVVLVGGSAADDGGRAALPASGVELQGPSPFQVTFLRPEPQLSAGEPDADIVMYERGLRMKPAGGAAVLCRLVEPYFDRAYDRFCGHDYTPPGRLSEDVAIVQHDTVVTIAVPLFVAFARHAVPAYAELLGACLDRLMPDPCVRAGGPAHLEVTAFERADRLIVHLISFLPSRVGDDLDLVTDPFPLIDVPVRLRLDKQPRTVTLQPSGQPLEWTLEDGYLHTTVSVFDGHAMIVVER